jgi:hypothetical protein
LNPNANPTVSVSNINNYMIKSDEEIDQGYIQTPARPIAVINKQKIINSVSP